jgi:hypothetical protein
MSGAGRNAAANIVVDAEIEKNFGRAGHARPYEKRGYYYGDIPADAAAPYSSPAKQQFATPPRRRHDEDNEEHGLDSLNLFSPRRDGNGSPSGRRRGA